MKFNWYNEDSKLFLSRGYLVNDETVQERIAAMAAAINKEFKDQPEIGLKAQEYMEQGYYVIPSPVWANYGTTRGTGISCFNSHLGDSVQEFMTSIAEIGIECKQGGGTSGYYGDIRAEGSDISTGGKANGPMYYLDMVNMTKNKISQNNVRRGEHAAFLNIDNPHINEFLKINTEGNAFQRLPFGVCVPTYWLDDMRNGDTVKQDIWATLLDTKFRTGYPYIFYTDNVNNNTVDVYKDRGLTIKSTNMCTEILLPSTKEESFVCDLMGINLVKWDEMIEKGIVEDVVRIAVYFADAMLTDFIRKNKDNPLMIRPVRFAERHRAIGIGASGYHTLLQSKMIPFESLEAQILNIDIFKTIQKASYSASEEMAQIYGKPEILSDIKYKRRHTCLTAVAPNTSSSFIMGQQSQSIEPYVSNYYITKKAKLKYTVKNPFLKELLIEKGMDTTEVWSSILKSNGSVQHLDCLDQLEKDIFRTFSEISQYEILTQAAQRQAYIDQGQSLNLMIHSSAKLKDINKLYLTAHDMGIKTLYYQLTTNAAQEFIRTLECSTCAG